MRGGLLGRATGTGADAILAMTESTDVEGRLLVALSSLVEDFAAEERRKRVTWEEKADRGAREFRASVEADMARAACESRRLFTEVKKEAAETKVAAQPCHDFFLARELKDLPGDFAVILKREVKSAAQAEVEVCLGAQGMDKLVKACTDRFMDIFHRERERSDSSQVSLDCRLGRLEATCRTLNQEMHTSVEEGCKDLQIRLGARLQQLSLSNTRLQDVLDRYTARWEETWKEEAEVRAGSDEKVLERVQTLTEAVDKQIRTLTDSSQKLLNEFEVERKTRQDSNVALACGWRELQAEFLDEREKRLKAEGKLANGIEELRRVVVKIVGMAEGRQRQHHTVTINQGQSDPAVFTAAAASTAAQLAKSVVDRNGCQSTSPSRATVQVANSGSPFRIPRSPIITRATSPRPRSREMTLDALAGPIVYARSTTPKQDPGSIIQSTVGCTPCTGYRV